MRMERGRPAPIGPGRPGSFWGHVDDADFQAREARWAVERAAARERFRRAAEYLGRLPATRMMEEMDRFEVLHGAIARREMEGCLMHRQAKAANH